MWLRGSGQVARLTLLSQNVALRCDSSMASSASAGALPPDPSRSVTLRACFWAQRVALPQPAPTAAKSANTSAETLARRPPCNKPRGSGWGGRQYRQFIFTQKKGGSNKTSSPSAAGGGVKMRSGTLVVFLTTVRVLLELGRE